MGILVTFSPEIGTSLGLSSPPSPGKAVMFAYIGATVGDLVSGVASQLLKSRRKAILLFLCLCTGGITFYFLVSGRSLTMMYVACFLLGATSGYWAVFLTVASEQFGTNLRATVSSTAPNFVRGSTVPITLLFRYLQTSLGIPMSAAAVGALTLLVAFVSLAGIEETYGKDLDYLEP
jgi:hypothetical protein